MSYPSAGICSISTVSTNIEHWPNVYSDKVLTDNIIQVQLLYTEWDREDKAKVSTKNNK